MPRLNPVYLAALALVGIQVGIGLIYKLAQRGGSYTFSTPSSIAISEFFKLILSATFFYHECKRRHAHAKAWYYSSLPDTEKAPPSKTGASKSVDFSSEGWDSNTISEKGPVVQPGLKLSTFAEYCRNEIPEDVVFSFAQLALLYALINNTAFALYKIADPGTISLIKSSITLVTALLTRFTLGTKIAKFQWAAIVIQVSGIIITQYHPGAGSSYPFYTYCLLFLQVLLSAVSGVYNQNLCKSRSISLHAGNMTLYASGAAINFLLHLALRTVKSDIPGFFSGYDSLEAKILIASNVLVGLAITAVYRYADAVIKCFATAVSTGVLLYLSPIFFNVEFSFMVVPGTMLVFVATWLYMESAPPKKGKEKEDDDLWLSKKREKQYSTSRFPRAKLVLGMILTTLIVSGLNLLDARMPNVKTQEASNHAMVKTAINDVQTVTSPFQNSLAYIRWASERPERMPLLSKYAPFFHTLHFSMPGYVKSKPIGFVNLTHDSYESPEVLFYVPLAETMELILTSSHSNPEVSQIDGIFNFHFDAWVSPLAFSNEDLDLIQYATASDPRFQCMTSLSRYPDYWGWAPDHLFQNQALAALAALRSLDLGYDMNAEEFCVGWSDIFYIPRAYFSDFVRLSRVFAAFHVFHEVAVPTIVHIIDRTYRARLENPYSGSLVNQISDCYGSCCSSGAAVEDVQEKRCGHRLDYAGDKFVIDATYSRLDQEAAALGKKIGVKKEMKDESAKEKNKDDMDLDLKQLAVIDRKLGEMRARGETEKAEGLDAVDRSVH